MIRLWLDEGAAKIMYPQARTPFVHAIAGRRRATRRRPVSWDLARGSRHIMTEIEPSRRGNGLSIILVDDRSVIRQGLRFLLQMEPYAEVIGEASSGAEALALAQRLRPDLVVMDVEMRGMDGITATALLRKTLPRCETIILTAHADAATGARAMAAGARAFVEKSSPDALLAALRKARDEIHPATN
jgi:CheY-like chemotaxis protein